MSGGGVAFSQALQSQDETNMGSGEPVVRYGTGGRIIGFDKGEIRDLARFGQNGDTILAHINPQEARMLKRMGGSGTINPITGLPQFDYEVDDSSSVSLEGGGGGGGDFGGPGDNYSGSGGAGGAYDLGINPDTGAVRFDFTGMAPQTPDYDSTDGVSDLGDFDYGSGDDDSIDDFLNTVGPIDTGLDDQVTDIVYTPGPVVTDTEEISEIIITTDRPTQTPFDTFTLTDTVTYFTETDSEEISEIIITTDRPTKTPVVTDTEEISEIIITTDRPTKTPVVTETDTEEISEIIITTDRPTPTPTVTITLTVTDTVTYVTETDTEEVSEIIITTDRPTPTPTVTITLTVTDTITYVTETDTEEISEIIITTDRPTPTPTVTITLTVTDTITYITETDTETDTETETETETVTVTETYTPRPTYTPKPTLPPVTQTPRPTTTPAPTTTPVPGRYRPQYQNYANPLTMFNVSNYGQDVPTSAGYNYAAKNQGIDALNQNLRDMAAKQIAQKYPDGLPKGADMDAVLREMRAVGLTPTDLENAYYGRTTGLNTPFSVYAKNPAMQTPFSFTDVQQPQTPQQKQVAMSNGIFDLINKLPK